MDDLDKEIMKVLKKNSRESCKSIGEKIHLTGQAVGMRIRALEESGNIVAYTIKENINNTQFFNIYMNVTSFEAFERFVTSYNEVEEFHKISGEGCYFIKTSFDEEALNVFLTKITKYARYKLNIAVKTII